MKIIKSFLFCLILSLFLNLQVEARANRESQLFIKGDLIDRFFIEEGSSLVGLEDLAEKLDLSYDYQAGDPSIVLKNNRINIDMKLNSREARLNNKYLELDLPPRLIGNKVYLPLRTVAESLGERLVWHGDDRIIELASFTQDLDLRDTSIYFNEKYSFSLNLGRDFLKNNKLVETENAIKFYNRQLIKSLEDSGPVLEIRFSPYPISPGLPSDGIKLLGRINKLYAEAIIGRDLQFTRDSQAAYLEAQEEILRVLKSFRFIDDQVFVEESRENYREEIGVLEHILDKFIGENIFNLDDLRTYSYPLSRHSLLYLDSREAGELKIKLELVLDEGQRPVFYHLKNYGYDLKADRIDVLQGQDLAESFSRDILRKDLRLFNREDVYPSLYEKNFHEAYVNEGEDFFILTDLDHNLVEFYSIFK